MRPLLLTALLASSPVIADDRLAEIIADSDRSEMATRDAHRHPLETLEFFGIAPDQDVLEIWPGGGGWYSRILAPYLKDEGSLTVALFGDGIEHRFASFFGQADQKFKDEIVGNTERNGQVGTTALFAPTHLNLGEADSYDMILTFRNLHNWMMWDQTEAHLAEFYRVLKPGGVLGLTDHRAAVARPNNPTANDGYVDEAYAIKLIQAAGFVLADIADINDNPRDTKDHPAGVWTLPPTYRLGETDREKYAAIGESDRFTLKFIKPE